MGREQRFERPVISLRGERYTKRGVTSEKKAHTQHRTGTGRTNGHTQEEHRDDIVRLAEGNERENTTWSEQESVAALEAPTEKPDTRCGPILRSTAVQVLFFLHVRILLKLKPK